MISQSTAEIKLLPLSGNGRPSYWNSISGFDVDLRIVIGKSFCIFLPNFVVIGRSSAELYDVISIFSRWPLAAILVLIWVMLDQSRSAIVGISLILKFGLNPIYGFGDIAIFIFCRFGLKLPIHAHFWGVLGVYFHQITSSIILTPKRHFLARKHVV